MGNAPTRESNRPKIMAITLRHFIHRGRRRELTVADLVRFTGFTDAKTRHVADELAEAGLIEKHCVDKLRIYSITDAGVTSLAAPSSPEPDVDPFASVFQLRGPIPDQIQDIIRDRMIAITPESARPRQWVSTDANTVKADAAREARSVNAPIVLMMVAEGISLASIEKVVGISRRTFDRIISEAEAA